MGTVVRSGTLLSGGLVRPSGDWGEKSIYTRGPEKEYQQSSVVYVCVRVCCDDGGGVAKPASRVPVSLTAGLAKGPRATVFVACTVFRE